MIKSCSLFEWLYVDNAGNKFVFMVSVMIANSEFESGYCRKHSFKLYSVIVNLLTAENKLTHKFFYLLKCTSKTIFYVIVGFV